MPRQRWLLAGLVLAALMVWPVWAWRRDAAAQDHLNRRRQALSATESEAERIVRLRRLPQKATETTPDQQYLHGILEELCRTVSLPSSALSRIEPAPSSRLGRSAYLEATTTVELKPVTLRQLTEFLFRIRQRRREFRLKALRLTQTDREDGLWDATLEFAFLVFQPVGDGRAGEER